MSTQQEERVAGGRSARAHWLARRRRGLGGSDAAAVLGLSRYATALDVYVDKLGLVEDEDDATEYQRWGSNLEPVLLREVAIRNNCLVMGRDHHGEVVDYYAGQPTTRPELIHLLERLQHPTHEWWQGEVDGLVVARGQVVEVVECKTTNVYKRDEWGEEGTDDIPDEYMVQVQHYLAILHALGIDVPCRVAVLIGGNDFRQYIVHRDEEWTAYLADALSAFWQRVQEQKPPHPTERDSGALGVLYPAHRAEPLEVSPQDSLHAQVLLLHSAKQEAKEAKEVVDELTNRLKARLGDAAGAVGQGWKISWRQNKGGKSTDWRAAFTELWNMWAMSEHPPQDVLRDEVVSFHTEAKKGARPFRVTVKAMEDGDE